MKTIYSGSVGGFLSSHNIPAFGFAGKLTRYKVTRPTVVLMTKIEARSFRVLGLRVSRVFSASSPRFFIEAILYAHRLSRLGKINIAIDGPFAILSKDGNTVPELNVISSTGQDTDTGYGMRKFLHRKAFNRALCYEMPDYSVLRALSKSHGIIPDIEIELESDPDGTPVIVVITPTHIPPVYKLKHVFRESRSGIRKDDKPQNNGGEPPVPQKYLKVPNDDMLIISALQETDKKLLNESHVKNMKYRGSSGYKIKQFNDIHLLVCLFFYIYVNGLNASGNFYFGQRGAFHEFCVKNVPQGINLGSKSYFTRCINKLENAHYSFKDYIKADKKPDIMHEIGDFDFVFWYEIYLKAESYFKQIIKPLP